MMKRLITFVSTILVALISGCAGYSPSKYLVGQDRTALMTSMGQPEREYLLDELSVLHYPRGPAGSHTYFIYIDRSDLVVRWEQVLTENRFDTLQPGMTKEQVIRVIGISTITNGLARNRGYVWHYRYETPHCKSFVIEFTPEDTIRSAGYRIRSGRRCKYVGAG